MKGDDKLYFAPFLTEEQMRARWPEGKMSNDMITSFSVMTTGHFGETVSPYFRFNLAQNFGLGYATTANIGFVVQRMAELLELFDDDTRDFCDDIKRTPVRIYHWGHAGDNLAKTFCIGHFMNNSFIYAQDLIWTGIPLEDVAELRKGGAE